jgi:hypothetical protein
MNDNPWYVDETASYVRGQIRREVAQARLEEQAAIGRRTATQPAQGTSRRRVSLSRVAGMVVSTLVALMH